MAIEPQTYDLEQYETRQRLEREFQELVLWHEHEHPVGEGDVCLNCKIGTFERAGSVLVCGYCGHEAPEGE